MIFLIKLEMKLNDLNDSNFQKEKMKKNYLKRIKLKNQESKNKKMNMMILKMEMILKELKIYYSKNKRNI